LKREGFFALDYTATFHQAFDKLWLTTSMSILCGYDFLLRLCGFGNFGGVNDLGISFLFSFAATPREVAGRARNDKLY
jgi:hypothetical protein